ncbi:MAG: hypothetical protein V1678_02145, partial [Candidatus Aenigmatarchaeota archaeon]
YNIFIMGPYSVIKIPRYDNEEELVVNIPDMRTLYLQGDQEQKSLTKGSIDCIAKKLINKEPFDEETNRIYKSAVEQLIRLRKEIQSIEERVMVV